MKPLTFPGRMTGNVADVLSSITSSEMKHMLLYDLCTFNAIILFCRVTVENGDMQGNLCHIKVLGLCFILRSIGISLSVVMDSDCMIQW